MMFLLSVLLFGLVHSAPLNLVENASHVDDMDAESLPTEVDTEAPVDPVLDPVMLEIYAQNVTNKTDRIDDDNSLADIKSLVSSMTKGDAKLTAFIVKKLGELRAKTYAEHKVINARVARKLASKVKEVAAKVVQDKKTALAVAEYAAEVLNSKYEKMQVNRELRSLDRIMAQLNAMSDWKVCKSGWKKFGRSCYKALPRVASYLAQGKCLSAGATLIRVDNADDREAVTYMSTKVQNYLILGFFRSLKTGNWQYLNNEEVNPASWYSWRGSAHNNKAYNYVRYYSGWKKIEGCYYSWTGGPLCEHRLAVNLLK
jgi:hypothetical protein